MKSCEGQGGPSTVLASICSESRCNESIGDVVSFSLASSRDGGGARKKGGWTTTEVSAGFNPVAMQLNNEGGDGSW